MALMSAQSPAPGGTTPTYGAANATDTFPCGDNLFLIVKVGATSTNVTVNSPSGDVCNLGVAGSAHSVVVSGLTNTERWFGPLSAARYGDPTAGGVGSVTYSQVTGVTSALVQF